MTSEPATQGSLLRRIHEAYAALPDSERRVADTILNAPAEMPVWTATELAGHAQVSNATVSRLVQRLGYRSFEQARQDARTLRETGSPLFMKETSARGTGGEPHADLLRTEAGLIEATLARLDASALREASRAIAGARQVRLMGFRNSRFLSDYLTAQLAQLRHDVAPLGLYGQTIAEGIAGLGPQDIAVVVGFRRRPARFSQIIRLIAERQSRVILIADKSLREAPAFATWTFTCSVETPLPIDSYVGALTLMRMLATETAAELEDRGIHHLNEVETLRETLGELESAPSAAGPATKG
ncbi:MurR/RpiR family transcriptional regulator [Tropicimonas aquimaris]|uniref:MurR/RpiR family transcriptional regulator n=1 Tax=Tropicimonas aquimaris TaxID=914152 RepID=A0ABW3IX53_9RHOB